jgi:hypothetical protein
MNVTCMHVCIYIRKKMHTYTHTSAGIYSMCIQMHPKHAHKYTYIHTHIHTYIHTYIPTVRVYRCPAHFCGWCVEQSFNTSQDAHHHVAHCQHKPQGADRCVHIHVNPCIRASECGVPQGTAGLYMYARNLHTYSHACILTYLHNNHVTENQISLMGSDRCMYTHTFAYIHTHMKTKQ